MERRLAAIMAADVVGYSRLMGEDEASTLMALRDLRSGLFARTVDSHRGIVVKSMGDGWLVEFMAVADSVTCAIELQEQLLGHEIIKLRIGVHLGDITHENEDIYGDGVNIAARLQEIAEPGAIVISDVARRSIDSKLGAAFADLGKQDLKNIADPVTAHGWGMMAVAAAVEPLPLPDKPSIVVLPFDNMSGDPEQEYFADGLTEDIITDLSRFDHLFVIARNTAFTYKGTKIDVAQVARDLGVHFVLEGSVRKAGNRVRITAQLIDGSRGTHVWAERYDGSLEDVFDLQDEVTRNVTARVAPQINNEQIRWARQRERVFDEAHDLAWRAQADAWEAFQRADPEGHAAALQIAERAIEINGKCAPAYATLCGGYGVRSLLAWDDPGEAADNTLSWANAAMVALPQSFVAYLCLGTAHLRKGHTEQAVRDYAQAVKLNPNHVGALTGLSFAEASLGDSTKARRHAEAAIRLSPKDVYIGNAHLALAMAAFVEGDDDVFIEAAESAILAHPVAPIRRALMISFAGRVGKGHLIRIHLDELNRFSPGFIASLFEGKNHIFAKREHMDLLLDGLRKVGLAD